MLQSSETLQLPARRTHRTYSAQFKVEMVAACAAPGASISALALAHGMNPNVLHRWLLEHERDGEHSVVGNPAQDSTAASRVPQGFVPLSLPAPAQAAKSSVIEVELHKGELHLNVHWPASLCAEFANWTAAVLR